MDVRMSSRRAPVSDNLRLRAEERLRKLEKYDPELLAVDLLFEEDHGVTAAEVRAEVPGLPTLVTRAEARSQRAALDQAVRKMSRRLRRERTRRVEHQAPPAALPGPE